MPVTGADRRRQWIDGVPKLAFVGCDYLSLSQDPAVLEAASEELRQSGLSTSAARDTTGTHRVHVELEERLADWMGTPAAAILADGALAGLALLEGIGELSGDAWIDDQAHPCLPAALRGQGMGFRLQAAATLEPAQVPTAWLTDGVYPLEARAPDLRILSQDLPQGAWLLVDDSHALGLRGRSSALGNLGEESRERLAYCSSLAKVLGSSGGVVAGPVELIRRVRQGSTYATTTPLAPALARAALTALDRIEGDPGLIARSEEQRHWLEELAGRLFGVRPALPLPVLGCIPHSHASAQRIEARLEQAGIHLPFTNYSGDELPGLFRVVLRAGQSDEDRQRLGEVLLASAADLAGCSASGSPRK